MNIFGKIIETAQERSRVEAGRLGIARLAAVYLGPLAPMEAATSMAHRIVFDAGRAPCLIARGATPHALSDSALRGVALLDARRFSLSDAEALQAKWRDLGDVANRLDDVLEDLGAVHGRRLSPRLSDALSLLRQGRTPRQVASALGVSETRLTRWFNAELGAAPKRWQVWMRLRRSVDLLVMGQSVTATSHEAGFADAAHFSRACSAVFGLPPSAIARLEVRAAVSVGGCAI